MRWRSNFRVDAVEGTFELKSHYKKEGVLARKSPTDKPIGVTAKIKTSSETDD
jgi:hypothetical protein